MALNRFLRRNFLNVFSISMLLLLTACVGIDEMRWKEQVWLHDGQLILLDRYSTRTKSGFPNSRRGPILSQEINYDPMQVSWKAKGYDEQPISFDVIDGAAYLVVNSPVSKEKFCQRKMKGKYVAVFYKWTSGRQQTISQHEAPIERMGNNVSGISQWGYNKQSDRQYLSWADVADATGQRRAGPPTPLKEFFEKRYWLRCE